jgi:hypothetical protein
LNITNIKPISVQRAGNTWTLTVKYTATFTDQEKNPPLNYTFRDSIQIMESDAGPPDILIGPDYAITGWVASHNFNPAENSVQRTLVTSVNGNDLDTEFNEEEIFARIQLRNYTTGGVPMKKKTATISLAP